MNFDLMNYIESHHRTNEVDNEHYKYKIYYPKE